jgi:DNA adenine methylase
MAECQSPQPFVKWVGGKRALMGELRARVPATFGGYFEPFVGGGALFFELAPEIARATLVDSNLELALTYQVIRKDPDTLIERLRREAARHSPEHYYRVRARSPRDPVGTAARFLYLNKTCFNGLYRVNKSGKFNAPLGRYTNPAIVTADNIRACSTALQAATVLHGDFEAIRPLVQRGDFVYFDPPYHPTSDDSFTAYTANNFTEKDQCGCATSCSTWGVGACRSCCPTRALVSSKISIGAHRSPNTSSTPRGRSIANRPREDGWRSYSSPTTRYEARHQSQPHGERPRARHRQRAPRPRLHLRRQEAVPTARS